MKTKVGITINQLMTLFKSFGLKEHFTFYKKNFQRMYGTAIVCCLDDSRCGLNSCPHDIELRYRQVTVILYEVIVASL